MNIFNELLITGLVVCFAITISGASFEDLRCKCVCSRIAEKNSTKPAQAVYISDNFDPNLCTCDFVVAPQNPQEICPTCECKYESRNTTTIKVVVIFIICVVSLLFVYMLFLLCLDPLIAHRPTRYIEHADEEVNLVILWLWKMAFTNPNTLIDSAFYSYLLQIVSLTE